MKSSAELSVRCEQWRASNYERTSCIASLKVPQKENKKTAPAGMIQEKLMIDPSFPSASGNIEEGKWVGRG